MSSDLLSLATFKSTTLTCFHWCFQWRKAISNVNYSQLLSFCFLLIKPPLSTTNAPTCFSWNMCSTLEMNPKFKIFNVCCMLCKWTQPTTVYFQFTNCIFATSAVFSTFYCIFLRCTLHPSCRPRGKRKNKPSTIKRCHTFPSPSSCETMRMFVDFVAKWGNYPHFFSPELYSGVLQLTLTGSALPKTQQNLKSSFCFCGEYSDNSEKKKKFKDCIFFDIMIWVS